ncbi:MAG: hypothetical protein HFG64_14465 [Lachnospiraceae bacterium]|nr:hypothetical protein [Lachnospiraceae bacterium]
MVNEDKIKLMTGIAMFEKREGKKIFPVNRYFRSDYISSHILCSFFCYSASFALGTVIWLLYNIEYILNQINLDDVFGIVKHGAVWYLSGLVLYLLVTWLVYWKRYEYARRGLKIYIAKLKRLEKRYEFQHKAKELTKEGGRHGGASRA